MKGLLFSFAVLTLPFLLAPVLLGLEASRLRSNGWAGSDEAFWEARSKQGALHLIVMGFSIPYFGLAAGIYLATRLKST